MPSSLSLDTERWDLMRRDETEDVIGHGGKVDLQV